MQIKGITNNNPFTENPNQVRKTEVKSSSDVKDKDKIEISSAARDLAKSDMASKKLEEIKQKIANKFYDSEEVINKIADAILKELKEK